MVDACHTLVLVPSLGQHSALLYFPVPAKLPSASAVLLV